jgi:hypothetical protein
MSLMFSEDDLTSGFSLEIWLVSVVGILQQPSRYSTDIAAAERDLCVSSLLQKSLFSILVFAI